MCGSFPAPTINNRRLEKLKPLVELVNQCKNIVVTLHFKKSLIEQELLKQEDKQVTEELLQKFSEAQQIIDLDDQLTHSADDEITADDETAGGIVSQNPSDSLFASGSNSRVHQTLKGINNTHWNSTFHTVESFLQLNVAANNAMKQIGKYDQCIAEDDNDILRQLAAFLKPFERLTQSVS